MDLGGTNLRLGVRDENGELKFVKKVITPDDLRELGQTINSYISELGVSPDSMVLAIAGPVSENRAVVTNCKQQVVDGSVLSRELGVDCRVINDFVAQVYGVSEFSRAPWLDKFHIKDGEPLDTHVFTVVGPGTGLGVGIGVTSSDGQLLYLPSEGGHQELSHPDSVIRDRLYSFLLSRLNKKRISMERVLSGSGIVSLYDFFYYDRNQSAPSWREELTSDVQLCSQIFSQIGEDPGATFTRDTLLSILGSFVGDLALNPLSEIFLVGNILGALRDLLSEPDGLFLNAFLNKGMLSPQLRKTRITGIFDDNLGLRGAGSYPF